MLANPAFGPQLVNGVEMNWVQLRMQSALANTVEDIDRNIEHSLAHPYIRFQDLVGKQSGAVSVVGSGPSLKKNWKKLRDSGTEIVACNAACQFLLQRGVVPKYMFCFDADPLMYEFLTPHKDITYLIASRVPPKTWELLKGCKIVCWHSAGDENIEKILQKHNRMEPMITGGSAAVTRAMILVLPLGYSETHIWGGDSSFSDGDTHIRKSTTEERRIQVMVNKRSFETAPWMANQAEDFKTLINIFVKGHGINIIVHGDGLIPHIARTEGLRVVDGEPLWRHAAREFFFRLKLIWKHL